MTSANINNPQQFIVISHLIIEREQKFFLLRRSLKSKYFPGFWHCVAGKIEEGESPRQAIIREASEEVSITTSPTIGTVVHVKTKHLMDQNLIWRDLGFFFVEKNLKEEPIITEPHLHDDMGWFGIDELPFPIAPVIEHALKAYARGETYTEFCDL